MSNRIKYEKRQNINVLLKKLESISDIDKQGRLTYHAFDSEEIEWNFLSIIDFGNILNVESRRRILSRTFREIVLKKQFEKKFFIEELEKQINIFNKRKENTYFLLNTLSIDNLPFRKIIFGDTVIQIHGKKFPDKFKPHRKQLLKANDFDNDIESFTKISIKVKSKDYKDAYTKGFYYLEIMRSFLCLMLNSAFEKRFGERERMPINKILRGETSSLHEFDGSAVDKNFFYFTLDYKKPKTLRLKDEQRLNIQKSMKWIVKAFNNCQPKHQQTISKCLNCYVDAFDEYSFDISFIKVWM